MWLFILQVQFIFVILKIKQNYIHFTIKLLYFNFDLNRSRFLLLVLHRFLIFTSSVCNLFFVFCLREKESWNKRRQRWRKTHPRRSFFIDAKNLPWIGGASRNRRNRVEKIVKTGEVSRLISRPSVYAFVSSTIRRLRVHS